MLCPNCKIKIKNNCCLKCGYMTNGNNVNLEYKNNDKLKDLRLYNKNFDIYYRNENYIWPLLLGPLYLSYRGNLILGTILGLIDCWLVNSILETISIPVIGGFSIYLLIFYLIVSRIIFGTTFNALCIQLDKLKIKYIKNKYPKDYKKKLLKHKNRIIYVLISILIYVSILV